MRCLGAEVGVRNILWADLAHHCHTDARSFLHTVSFLHQWTMGSSFPKKYEMDKVNENHFYSSTQSHRQTNLDADLRAVQAKRV